jgi:hypothetical protein
MRWLNLRRILVAAAALVLLLLAAAAVLFLANARDRHPGYAVDLRAGGGRPAPLRAGFGAATITPEVPDRWTDEDGDAQWDEGEPWQDGNGNGRFDAVWLAGFQNRRPAAGVHDPLWARAMVLDDGATRVAIVVLDAIGLMHDQVVDIRRRLPPELGLTYTIVCSTHTHQAPDLQGLWGPGFARSGVVPAYRERVVEGAARAVARAVGALQPAVLRFARVPDAARPFVEDSRRPLVLDPGLRVLHAVAAVSGRTLGTFVTWGNHPETAWRHNLLVSSDYPHYLREALEEGLVRDGQVAVPGLGGTAVFAVGAIGGLMTTRPGFGVPDPFTDVVHEEPSFEKARAQGQQIARLVLAALGGDGVVEVREAAIALRARTLEVPLDNPLLLVGASLGAVERGFASWGSLRTEVAALRIGPASFVAVPGEIYPEIVNGGITSPPGADFDLAPVEVPPLRERMPGRFRFVLGLANDAIGYLIPKSEWDDEAPWIYGAEEETYGEIVSLGPDTAPLIHRSLLETLEELDEITSEPGRPRSGDAPVAPEGRRPEAGRPHNGDAAERGR